MIIFLGAGASKMFGIPDMLEMVQKLEKNLGGQELLLYNKIKDGLKGYQDFDIEALITVLEHIVYPNRFVNVFNHPSIEYFLHPKEILSTMKRGVEQDSESANNLLITLKDFIRECCTLKGVQEEKFKIYDKFFDTVLSKTPTYFERTLQHRGQKGAHLEIFTTNYDTTLESYCRSRNLLYENGEIQGMVYINRDNNLKLYSGTSEQCFKIFKLHGSVYWFWDKIGNIIAIDTIAKPGGVTIYGERLEREMAIYPARELYTFKEPYYDAFHHLKDELMSTDGCCVVGYSFRDYDLRTIFIDAMKRKDSLKMYLIDPCADNVSKERLTEIDSRISKIEKPFGIEAIEALKQKVVGG